MSVRNSLLAILDQGPCYGNQLRAEFERRTGGAWTVNVGQIYTTLDRLERDGLATRGAPDAQGHIHWSITAEGSVQARAWIGEPVAPDARHDVATKLALAMSLPGVDAAALIQAQRAATTAAVSRWRGEPDAQGSRAFVLEFALRAAEAELAWLDHCEAALASTASFALHTEPPRRGRPLSAATRG